MKRALLLTLGWFLASGSVYFAALALDAYWNLFDWRPRWDLLAAGLAAWMAAGIGGIWLLARASLPAIPRTVSILACVALLAAASKALPAEPRSEGLLGRDQSSPTWYRTGRLALMALPALGLAVGQMQRRRANRAAGRAVIEH